MFQRDPDAVAALRALRRADGWHTARAALPRAEAEAEGQPLEPAEPNPERRPACGALATPGWSGPGHRRVACSICRRSLRFA
jgi:hypothetical protein